MEREGAMNEKVPSFAGSTRAKLIPFAPPSRLETGDQPPALLLSLFGPAELPDAALLRKPVRLLKKMKQRSEG
jgi:hypothetical protein